MDLQALSDYLDTAICRPPGRSLRESKNCRPRIGLKLAPSVAILADWKPAYGPKWGGTEKEVLDGLDELMKEIVPEHLMSDVPLGAFLSGGIDSSTIVAYAALASPEPLRTFSVGVHDRSQSELPWARLVAERYLTRHFEEIVEPDLVGLAPLMTSFMEEPVDPFAVGVYAVLERCGARGQGLSQRRWRRRVVRRLRPLCGQTLAERYSQIPAPARRKLLRPLLRLIPESFGYKSLATKLRWLDQMAELEGVDRYIESAGFLRFPPWSEALAVPGACVERSGATAQRGYPENAVCRQEERR